MIILKTLFGGSLELPQKEFIAEAEKAIEGCRQTDAACLPVSGTACLEYIGGLLAQYMGMLESRRIEGRKLRGILRNIAAVSAHSLSTLEGTEPGGGVGFLKEPPGEEKRRLWQLSPEKRMLRWQLHPNVRQTEPPAEPGAEGRAGAELRACRRHMGRLSRLCRAGPGYPVSGGSPVALRPASFISSSPAWPAQ